MAEYELQAEPRTIIGKGLKKLRDQGNVPVVLYGQGSEARSLQVEKLALSRLLARGGAHNLVSLSIAGTKSPQMVLVREVQREVTRPEVLHVDFYTVVMSEKLQTDVPLVIVGESPAVVEGLAAVVQIMDTLQVECLPGNLPPLLQVDISGLETTDQNVLVGDISVPEGVELLDDLEGVVISLAAARELVEEEEEALELEAPEAGEVEVMAKGKEAQEGEGEGADEAWKRAQARRVQGQP